MIPNPNKSNTRKEMAEDDAINDNEKLLILPLNDKNSKKISQVISSDTARNILDALASTPRSASEIAEKLGIPLTTVQYNLEKLYDAGLVKVERTKYSRKMKPVKLYAPQRKFVVIAPGKADKKDVIAALKRYLTVIVFAAFGSAAIEFLTMKLKTPALEEAARGIADQEAPAPMYAPTLTPSPEKALDTTVFGFDIFAHPGLWFLFGALFVILVVFLIEFYGRKKERKEKIE
jgi:DNA-binding transcriptional ArsR family regulator